MAIRKSFYFRHARDGVDLPANVTNLHMCDPDEETGLLKRTLGVWALTFYGIGDILGAGIYALVGKVAGVAGPLSWLSFLIAMLAAGLTGLSYCELVSRYPQSAGESTYTLQGLRRPALAFFVGWLVFCSGVFSMSAVAHACVGYVQSIAPDVPAWCVWMLFVALVSIINFWGIRQSSMTNIVFTLVEISGLLLAIVTGLWYVFHNEGHHETPAWNSDGLWTGTMTGAALAFFSYIGFEDMINVAEEVRDPRKTFPRAIITAVLFCGTLYLTISVVALAVVPATELAQSRSPLLDVVHRAAPSIPPSLYVVIALIAVANTGLLNSVMASRLLYGMAAQNLLPGWLGRVHPKTQTPHYSVATIGTISVILIISGTLTQLAATTSLLLLVVFSIVNFSLVAIHLREGRSRTHFSVPIAVPITAIFVCGLMAAFVERTSLIWGGAIALVGLLLGVVSTRRGKAVLEVFEER